MVKLDRIRALLSSTYANRYPAYATIDGNYNTICASAWQPNAWLSVEVPPDSTIDYIAIYNRVDHATYASWLNPIEVWVGETAGDVSSDSAVQCSGPIEAPIRVGENVVDAAFVVACPTGTRGSYFTVKQTGRARYLTLLEVEAYSRSTSTASSMLAAAAAAVDKGSVADVATVAAPASGAPSLPAYDEIIIPVAEDSAYVQAAVGERQAVVETAVPSEQESSAEEAAGPWKVAAIALSVPLLCTLLAVVGLLVWVATLRRSLTKLLADCANVKISSAPDVSKRADVAFAAVDIESTVVESSLGSSLGASSLAAVDVESSLPCASELTTSWQPSSRKSSAEI